jgi:hypothetical protein
MKIKRRPALAAFPPSPLGLWRTSRRGRQNLFAVALIGTLSVCGCATQKHAQSGTNAAVTPEATNPVVAQGSTNAVLAPEATNAVVTQGGTNAVLTPDATNAIELATLLETPERPDYRPWTIGLEAGTTGIYGGNASWRFADHVGVGLAADFGQATWNDLNIAGIPYNAKLRLAAQPLVLNLYPWKKHSFHFGLGLMFNENQLTGTASETGTVIIAGHPLPITTGLLSMQAHQQLVNPYLSLGGNFFYFDHAHHWAAGGELGVAYTGKPEVHLSRAGASSPAIDAALDAAEYELKKYASQYQWWPVLKLNVTYSF